MSDVKWCHRSDDLKIQLWNINISQPHRSKKEKKEKTKNFWVLIYEILFSGMLKFIPFVHTIVTRK